MMQSRERLFREPFRDLIAVHLSRDVRHVGARTLPSQTHHHRPRQRMRHNLPRRELTRGRASLTIVRPHVRDVPLSIPSLGAPPRERRLVRARRRRARERRPSPARLRPIASHASSLLDGPSSQRVRPLPSRRVRSSTHASRADARPRRRVPARAHPSHARVRRERHPRTHAQSIHRVDDGRASRRTVLSRARARHHRSPPAARARVGDDATRAGELRHRWDRPACRYRWGTRHESRLIMTHRPIDRPYDRRRSYSHHSNVHVRTNYSIRECTPEIDPIDPIDRARAGTVARRLAALGGGRARWR